MPSPFPGMNPYLEQEDAWRDFHDTLIPMLRKALTPQVSPHYIVKVEAHLYFHEHSAGQRLLISQGDVQVARVDRAGVASGTATGRAPARIRTPAVDEEKQLFLEVRAAHNRDLVTVVEMLSPTNKTPGPDREQYLAKRAELLRGTAHCVEIDLLRGWSRMPMEMASASDYCIMVSRVEERRDADYWPINLSDRLPTIPIPLRPPTPDAIVDLQEILHQVYDDASYQDYIYAGKPAPALTSQQEAWAASFLGR